MTRCLLLLPLLLAADWPQWRGPTNDSRSPETGLPAEFGPEQNLVWKLKLPGRGSSTPCVWGDSIFLTALADDDRVVICAGTDGNERWRRTLSTGGKKALGMGGEGDDCSASCSTDGQHVWACVGAGVLACFDFAGTEVWRTSLQDYAKFKIQFGTHWTPALYKGRLYLQVMHHAAQKLVCLDAATGKEVWQVDRPGEGRQNSESPDVYASAFVWEGPGGPLLIAHGNDNCTAHKLADGAEVWRVGGLNPQGNRAWRFVSSPLVTPDLIVIPTCKTGPTVALDPAKAQGTIGPGHAAERWRFKSTPDVVSPLRVDDVVYLMDNGPLTALDALTGQQLYREPLTKQLHRANLLAADGKIYSAGRDGAVDVVKAGRTFQQLAANKLPDKLYGSPVAAGGRLYVRGHEYLWAFGAK